MLKAVMKDRRAGRRFPIKMNAKYRFFPRGDELSPCHGKSRTVDISSTGILLRAQEPSLTEGVAADVLVEWPAAGGSGGGLELRVQGTVVRSDSRGTVVKVCRYGFQPGKAEPATVIPITETPRRQFNEVPAESEPEYAAAAVGVRAESR
jgi:hypothetical protein